MSEGRLADKNDANFRLMAVIVLYRVSPDESVAFKSLQAAMLHSDGREMALKVLLYDNTPNRCDHGTIPDGVLYEAAKQNKGLATAYNRALEVAEAEGFEWLLTLDQDTSLPGDFLSKVTEIIARVSLDESIAAVVPQMTENGRAISPYRFRLGSVPSYLPHGFTGVPKGGIYALNSASTIRVSALRVIGGYDPRFWLDCSDTYLYRQLFRHGLQTYVAGNIQVNHQFSMLDMNQRVSLARYQNILDAGCAFCDLELGWIAGVDYTARLIYRVFYKHWRHGHHPAFRRASVKMLKRRLLWSKKRRMEKWKRETENRLCPLPRSQSVGRRDVRPQISVCMAAYNGERYIAFQLQSILGQLADGDEVVVVDDASRDGTVAIIEGFHDRRIRILRNSDNRGVVNSFERAILEAKGAIIFLSDQDDLWSLGKIQRVMQVFDDPKVTLALSDANMMDEDGNLSIESYFRTRGGFSTGVVRNIFRNHYIGCTMAFRREMLQYCLPFPNKLPMHDSWIGIVNDLLGNTAYIDEPLVNYRRHARNVSQKGSLVQRIRWRANLVVIVVKLRLRIAWNAVFVSS